MTSHEPPPGSREAVDSGCICPVLDNGYGQGYMGLEGVYVMSVGCPLIEVEGEDETPGLERAEPRVD